VDLRLAPAILQAYVPGVDIRVTVVAGRIFATAIDARQTGSPEDFRPVYAQANVSACRLPVEIEAGVRALVDSLGLSYAAIDLRRTDDGRHLFLEVNPAGQWLFLEDRTGQPITRAVADGLVEAARATRQAASLDPLAEIGPWSQAC
jgi:glutathione synthase/RimK-type ligase-like ATP-grasp enzyme